MQKELLEMYKYPYITLCSEDFCVAALPTPDISILPSFIIFTEI